MIAEKVFAVIAESTRRDILQALAQESKAVGQLVEELGVAQPTVSKHLRVLREAGVVTMRAQGQKRFYCINAEPLTLISTWLESLGAGVAPAAPAADVPADAPAARSVEEAVAAPDAVTLEAPNLSGAAEMEEPAEIAEPEADAAELLVEDVVAAFDPAPDHLVEELLEKVPAAAAMAPSAAGGATVLPEAVTAAAGQSVAGTPVAKPPVVPFAGGDASVQGQLSRSMGRAAGRAVDLLTSLPTLPKLRRKKDQ